MMMSDMSGWKSRVGPWVQGTFAVRMPCRKLQRALTMERAVKGLRPPKVSLMSSQLSELARPKKTPKSKIKQKTAALITKLLFSK